MDLPPRPNPAHSQILAGYYALRPDCFATMEAVSPERGGRVTSARSSAAAAFEAAGAERGGRMVPCEWGSAWLQGPAPLAPCDGCLTTLSPMFKSTVQPLSPVLLSPPAAGGRGCVWRPRRRLALHRSLLGARQGHAQPFAERERRGRRRGCRRRHGPRAHPHGSRAPCSCGGRGGQGGGRRRPGRGAAPSPCHPGTCAAALLWLVVRHAGSHGVS
jgi:hypothetical protein